MLDTSSIEPLYLWRISVVPKYTISLGFLDNLKDDLSYAVRRRVFAAFMRACAPLPASRAALFTTPNRWFPVELHTFLPVVHWLPKPAFRRVLRTLGYGALSLDLRRLKTAVDRGGSRVLTLRNVLSAAHSFLRIGLRRLR